MRLGGQRLLGTHKQERQRLPLLRNNTRECVDPLTKCREESWKNRCFITRGEVWTGVKKGVAEAMAMIAVKYGAK